jgi:hypothetical protein
MTEQRPEQAGPHPLEWSSLPRPRIDVLKEKAANVCKILEEAVSPQLTPQHSPTSPLSQRESNPPDIIMNEEPKRHQSPHRRRQPDPKPLPKPELSLLAIAVARAFKAADDAATPPTTSELTSITDHHWLTPPDIVMGKSSSSVLDLDNPHWTET